MKARSICVVAPNAEGALRARFGLDPGAPYGGAEVQISYLAEGWRKRGHAVSLIVSGAESRVLERDEVGGVHVLRLPRRSGLSGWRSLRIQTDLRRALREARPSLVYQRCALPLTGQVAWHCARLGIPFVFGVANDRDLDGRIQAQLGFVRGRLFEYGLRRAGLIVVQSRAQEVLLPAETRARAVRIPSVFDAADVPPRPLPASITILWASNLLAKKRPLLLLDLARALPEIEFIAAGAPGTDTALVEAFTSQAASLPNLRYLGHVPPGTMGDLYSRATLLLNTSDAEGFPNTFLEAWAREVPVVTLGSDPDGIVQSLGLGLVLDRTEAPERLRHWLSGAQAIQEAGRAGRAHVLAHHQADRVLDQYEQAFSRLEP